MTEKTFRKLVIVFVMFVGAGFGIFTGFAYSESYWWVGMIAGAVSSYPLAKLYLKQLIKISIKGYNKKMIWFLSTLVAVICGIICTTLAHGIMLWIIYDSDKSLLHQMEGFWLLFLSVGEAVGACAGLIAGGICSLIYVLSVKGKANEIA